MKRKQSFVPSHQEILDTLPKQVYGQVHDEWDNGEYEGYTTYSQVPTDEDLKGVDDGTVFGVYELVKVVRVKNSPTLEEI
jgi:hypothetical protein